MGDATLRLLAGWLAGWLGLGKGWCLARARVGEGANAANVFSAFCFSTATATDRTIQQYHRLTSARSKGTRTAECQRDDDFGTPAHLPPALAALPYQRMLPLAPAPVLAECLRHHRTPP